MHSVSLGKSFRAETITVTLKFGFQQNQVKYSTKDVYNSIIERLYEDAEKWLRSIASNSKHGICTGNFTIYLFRILATEFTMIPVMQPSDIEQDSLIEIVLVPIETSPNAHHLYRSQLNIPTNCSRCSRFIAGLYKQGFRCRKCRMTFHQDCALFLPDDCTVLSNATTPPASLIKTFKLFHPFTNDLGCPSDRTLVPSTKAVPIFRLSKGGSIENARSILPNAIIDRGIFPACMRGAHFTQRYLFLLTTNLLCISPNLSTSNVSKQELAPTTDADTIILLTDIVDLVLTHAMPDRDDVFEIHLPNKHILSVGKRTDSDGLQMETAQFYSTIRYTRETLTSAGPPTSSSSSSNVESAATPTPGTEVVTKRKNEPLPALCGTKSVFRVPPAGEDNQDKDLHELYMLTNEKLGEGAFGRVMRGFRKSTNHEVAIKILQKTNCSAQDIQDINKEISNLREFNHPNILRLEAYFERADDVCLVTERMETDLCHYIISSKNGYLEEDICQMIIYQVIVALRYLHRRSYGHLDVKCDNILLTRLKPIPLHNNKASDAASSIADDFLLVKLADFGYSKLIGEHSFRKTHVGTKVYNAPEMYHSKQGYNRIADMWSVGIVLYASLSGTLPFDEDNTQRAEEIVSDKKTLFSGVRWDMISKEATDLLANQLLVIKPTSRVNPNVALFHAWFTNFDLYQNLREIQRRTEYLLKSRQQEPLSPPKWLICEREDDVWVEYHRMYAEIYGQK